MRNHMQINGNGRYTQAEASQIIDGQMHYAGGNISFNSLYRRLQTEADKCLKSEHFQ